MESELDTFLDRQIKFLKVHGVDFDRNLNDVRAEISTDPLRVRFEIENKKRLLGQPVLKNSKFGIAAVWLALFNVVIIWCPIPKSLRRFVYIEHDFEKILFLYIPCITLLLAIVAILLPNKKKYAAVFAIWLCVVGFGQISLSILIEMLNS